MSSDNPVTPPSTTPAIQQAPAAPVSRGERIARAKTTFNNDFKAPQPRLNPVAPATEPVSTEVAPAVTKPTQSDDELNKARMLRDLQKREAETLNERKQREQLQARLDKLEKMDELEKIGGPEGLRKLIERGAKGEIKVPSPEEEKLSVHDQELKELREWKQAQEKREQDVVAKQQVQEELTLIKTRLDEMSEEYALASSFPNAPALIRRAYQEAEQRGEDPDVHELFAQVEANILNDASSLVSNERAVKHLLKTNEVFKKIVTDALGLSAPAKDASPVVRQPPRSLTATVAATVPSRGQKKLSENDRKARGLSALQRLIESGDI